MKILIIILICIVSLALLFVGAMWVWFQVAKRQGIKEGEKMVDELRRQYPKAFEDG